MQGSLENINFNIQELNKTTDGARFKVSIQVPMSMGFIERMKFIIDSNNERRAFQLKHIKNENNMVYFETEIELPTKALYHYYFSFEANHNFIYFKKTNKTDNQTITPEEKWNMSVNFDVPEWAKGAVMYHIFVDRFNRTGKRPPTKLSNRTIHKSWDEDLVIGPNRNGIWNADFYCGSLKGIEEKLDYIKSLGVNILYLSPVVKSQSNHRYDAADYEQVDPYAGTNQDLKDLCDKAHEMGMKVVLDAVFNHTGNDSRYFNEFDNYPELGAYQSKDSRYYSFYKHNDYFDENYQSRWNLVESFPTISEKNKNWSNYIFGAKGIIDIWYHFDKDHKTESQEIGLKEEIKNWGIDFFTKLGYTEETIKYENDIFHFNNGKLSFDIANRMMYVLHDLMKDIEKLNIPNLKLNDILNYVFLDALLTFYKTNNGAKLSLVFDEFKKIYPKNTIYHIVKYIDSIDITKFVNTMTNEKVDEQSKKPYRKYTHNDARIFSYWWGMGNLPVCEGKSEEWQQYIYGENGVIDLWFSLGIDGLRLDVADELSDEFIEGIRTAVKRNKPDGFILGEVWKNPMRMGRSYIESGKGMDSVMDYVLVDALLRYFKYGDVTSIAEVIRQLRTEYPEGTLQTLMNFTSTHDISRAINLFGCDEFKRFNSWAWDLYNENRDFQKSFQLTPEQYEYGKQLYKSYIYFLTFFPGIISTFYGDEVGLQGLGNLANRRTFPWGKEDKDLLAFFRYMGSIRQKEQFLRTADVDVYDITDRYILFERKAKELDALVAINRTDNPIPTPLPEKYFNVDTIYPLGSSDTRSIDSHGGLVLKKVKK